jgi:hypothetical protein
MLALAMAMLLGLTACGGGENDVPTPVIVNVQIPEVTPIKQPDKPPPADEGPAKIVADQTDSGPPSVFKTCHGMSTRASLFRTLQPARVIATTTIWSHCWIGGFTGTAAVLIGDADGDTLGYLAANESWGVNGQSEAALGGTASDRTVFWQANVEDASVLPLARTLSVVHSWAPRNRIIDILRQAVAAGKSFVEVAAAIAALAA